jgi:hypothetical protein
MGGNRGHGQRVAADLGEPLPHSHDCRPSGLVGAIMLETVWVCPWAGGDDAARVRKEDAGSWQRRRIAASRRRAVEIPDEPLFAPAFPPLSPTPRPQPPYPNRAPC